MLLSKIKNLKTSSSGFTIIELLVVIIVIAILATLVVSSYSSIQAKARDGIRKQDFQEIKKALLLYKQQYGDYIEDGSNCGNLSHEGEGWFNVSGGSFYEDKSINDCLVDSGFLGEGVSDPSGHTSTSGAYMKLNCGSGDTRRSYIITKLETMPSASLPTELSDCPNKGWWNTYNQNYFVLIQ